MELEYAGEDKDGIGEDLFKNHGIMSWKRDVTKAKSVYIKKACIDAKGIEIVQV